MVGIVGWEFHYCPWTVHTIVKLWMWHDITAFGQHTQSNDVGHGMTSPPLGSTHGRMTSGIACHHRLWTAHTEERRRAWHDIITFGQHTRLNYVGRGMPSSPLGSTNGRTSSGVACRCRLWTSSHSLTVSSLACHHCSWTGNMVERRIAWHAINNLGQHTQKNDVGRGMTSSPLGSTHT